MTDSQKLNALADWFDVQDDESGNIGATEVQDDLRRIAKVLADMQTAAGDESPLELIAAAKRLPRTKDGVRVTPEMEVWLPHSIVGAGNDVRSIRPVLCDRELLGQVEEYWWTYRAAEVYSTREAAEAARKAGKP